MNEESFWSPLPIRYNLTRVSLAGTLTGLEGIRQGRNLKIKPYAVAGIVQGRTQAGLNTEFDYDGGIDLKYGLTPSLTLDATYRTDFSQAEVDQDQVNLTRFDLFFPEKREFFLENSAVFGFGARGTGGHANLLPFFSRRIGLSDTGTPIPIVGGTRVSGTAGRNEIGFLAMKTERLGAIPSNNFVVGRIRRNLLRNSFIGAMVTSREAPGTKEYNRVYGADAVLQFFNRLDVSGYLLKSATPGIDKNQDASRFSAGWRDDELSFGADYEKVGDNFRPEVGFIRRDDNTHYSGDFTYQPRLDGNSLIRDLTFATNLDYYSDVGGKLESRTNDFRFSLEFENSATATFNTSESFERLHDSFRTYSVPAGDYKFRDYTVSYNSDRSRLIGGRITTTWGDFWNGTRRSAGGDVTFKPNYHWQADVTYSRNDIDVPAGEFVTTLVGMKVLYAFTSRMFLNTFLQYNAERHQFTSNIRFNIIHRPLSDIYVVFNERRDTRSGQVLDRGVIFKFTNLFNF